MLHQTAFLQLSVEVRQVGFMDGQPRQLGYHTACMHAIIVLKVIIVFALH